MAYTTAHPIRFTLDKALDYICNPDKTEYCQLISAINCRQKTMQKSNFDYTRKI